MASAGTQIFDDGSSISFDAGGNVTGVVNSAGVPQYVPPPDGSAVMQEFSALFSQGVQAVASTVANKLKGSLAGSAAPATGTPQSQASVATSATLKKYLPAVLIVVLAVAGYHYVKH